MSEGRAKPTRIIVGLGTCGLAAGAQAVYDAVVDNLKDQGLDVELTQTGCIGLCEEEPLVDVVRPGEPRVTYGKMTPERVRELVAKDILGGETLEDWVVGRIDSEERPYAEHFFYQGQKRLVLRNLGFIDPEKLSDYLDRGGYQALPKVLAMTPEEVIAQVKTSGLRGRGGAGFPTGLKWELTRQAVGDQKYIICNADEGDPGAFMDRSVLEGDPHRVLEGMAIAAYAIGASAGYIYVRAEYPLAIRRLKTAIAQAEAAGYLGPQTLGTDFSLKIRIKEGAGAFVCGEETALLASVEGRRGTPRSRPPFPAQKGLWGRPTSINNVETFANITTIILAGGEAFARLGTEKSKGTKVFALTGQIRNTGLAEVEMGVTLRQIIEEIGGGIRDGQALKGIQIGGPSGGCLPAALLDTPVDYESLVQAGAIMGSGGLVVLDDNTCMVDLARYFMSFLAKESCGKCVPCREGTQRMLEILERITAGEGTMEDLDRLEALSTVLRGASLCALGQTAPNTVQSTLRYFREEYLEHIEGHYCRAGACQALKRYRIIPELCIGCGICRRQCPTGAITGKAKGVHLIDQGRCSKCGLCQQVCPTDAVISKGVI